MDIFIEQIIKRKKDGKDYAFIAGLITAGIILSLAAALLIGRYSIGIAFILIAAVWYVEYLLIHTRNLEYEYILTNSDLDVDKIVAKRGRKRIVSINLKEIIICANVEDSRFVHEYQNTANLTKTVDVIGNKADGNIYFVDYHLDGENIRVLFQPNEKLEDALRTLNPRYIHIMEH